MQWFRMYGEFATDPKVQSMSEALQRRLLMLLCLRCSNDLVTLQRDEVAFALRISNDELTETLLIFERKGFIDSDLNVLNWDKRQYASDSSAARVRKHRENKIAKPLTPCNVTVTPPEQNRTEQIQKNISCDKSHSQHGFNMFWQSWPPSPRKVNKTGCLKKWRKEKLEQHAERIVAHVTAMQRTEQWRTGFEPAPLTYLNQCRYDDDIPEPSLRIVKTEMPRTDEQWVTTGRQLGLEPKPGEGWPQFQGRVRSQLEAASG